MNTPNTPNTPNIKVLYKTEYFERILYVLKINDKATLVYKSSGLSGTGHGGEILPFMYLNTEERIYGPVLGYIFKEVNYNGKYRQHRKEAEEFQMLPEKLKIIKDFLIDTNEFDAPTVSPDTEDLNSYKNFVISVNDKLRSITSEYEEFDFLLDSIKKIK